MVEVYQQGQAKTNSEKDDSPHFPHVHTGFSFIQILVMFLKAVFNRILLVVIEALFVFISLIVHMVQPAQRIFKVQFDTKCFFSLLLPHPLLFKSSSSQNIPRIRVLLKTFRIISKNIPKGKQLFAYLMRQPSVPNV